MRHFIPIARLSALALSALALSTVALAAQRARPGVKCASAPAVVRGITGGYDVFVIGSDKQLHQAIHDGKTWKWVNLGDTCHQGVSATRSTRGRIDLFSVDAGGKLIQKIYDKDWAKEWVDLGPTPGGKCASAPAAVLSTTGYVSVFVVGSDKQLHQAAYDGRTWKWSTVGGTCRYGASAVAHLQKIDVFTVDKDGGLERRTWNKAWGKDGEGLGAPAGGKCVSAPAALVTTTGRFDVFVLGADKQVYQRYDHDREWKWAALGGTCEHGVAATSGALGRIDVFAIDKDGNLVQRVYDKDWSKEWVNLGMPAR